MAQSPSSLLNIKTISTAILPPHLLSSNLVNTNRTSLSYLSLIPRRIFNGWASNPSYSKFSDVGFGVGTFCNRKGSSASLRIRCLSGSSGGDLEETIKTQIGQNPVVIYSKTWCPYCQEAKGLFQELGVKPFVVELDELGTGERQMQDALKQLTGQTTVPNIFVGGKHIGGCIDTMELYQNGELISLLSAAGVKAS